MVPNAFKTIALAIPLAFAAALAGCSDDGDGDGGSNGDSGGTATGGTGATSGTTATGGTGGSAGSGITGGTAGSSNGGATPTGGSSGGGGRGGSSGASNPGGSGGTAGGATTQGPRFIGRFTSDNRFAWSGSTIALRFTGTGVSVTFENTGDNFMEAVVDGGTPRVLALSSGRMEYAIATGLTDGPHEVRVTRRTEAFFNPSKFISFSVPESAWLPSTAPERRIEVIGDSITAGYGIEGQGPTCPFEPDTENHALTYEALAAKELGADLHTEAWSGIGIYRNNSGDMTGLMPERFTLIIPTESGTTWDFSKFQPHAVVVNLGTNDFAGGDPGMGFQQAHEDFAASLRMRYPNAHIYLAVGPMLSGGNFSAALAYLEGAVAARRADGDDAIDTIEFATTMSSEGFGCDYHPNEVTNERLANVLVARLKSDLGW